MTPRGVWPEFLLQRRTIGATSSAPVRDRGRRGFTIVEVMVAASVLALAITTSITVMQRGFATLDTARSINLAAQIMQSEIEKLRLKDWATVIAYPTTPTALTIDAAFTNASGVGNRFTLKREISTPQTDMREITLTVTWTGLDGRALSRNLVTYYCRYGLYDFYYNGTP